MSSTTKPNRAIQIAIWGTASVLLVLAVYAIRSLTQERVDVVAAKVSYQDVGKSFSTTGKVEPINDFQVYAPTAGQVQDVYVNVGDKVKPGQLLLKMDDKDALSSLANAQSTLQAAALSARDIQQGGTQEERNTFAADLNKATLQRQQDAADLAARQKLLQQGAASPAEVAEAQHRLQIDDADIAAIQQRSTKRYDQADAAHAAAALSAAHAGVAAAQDSYNTADIRSKVAGTVYYLPVAQYDYVTAGENLVYVADLTRMRVTAYFDEPDIGNLAVGQPVTITWETKPGLTWHGHISQIPTTVQEYQQRFVGQCLIAVDDADGVLVPDANVTIYVTTAEHPHVLTIPHQALLHDGAVSFVYRIVDNKLVRTSVEPGLVNVDRAEIKSGLSEGDMVATHPTNNNRTLTDGLSVTPVH
jgi:HlyD family secretion protein